MVVHHRRSLIQALLQELLRINRKPAFELATRNNPSILERDAFLSLFLEAENMNPQTAAHRLVAYFEHKKDVWGPGMVSRDLNANDLTQQDIQTLASGFVEFIPGDNTNERAMVVFNIWKMSAVKEETGSLVSRLTSLNGPMDKSSFCLAIGKYSTSSTKRSKPIEIE